MRFLLDHTILGFCWFDLIALALLVVVVYFTRKKLKAMKEEKEALEDKLANKNAGAAAKNNEPAAAVEQNAPNLPEEGSYG